MGTGADFQSNLSVSYGEGALPNSKAEHVKLNSVFFLKDG